MIYRIKNYLKARIAATAWFQLQLRAARQHFEPYVKELDLPGIDGRFFFATQQAKDWYDPVKAYAKLEYRWIVENVHLINQSIVDAGAHHGHYSVFFALASNKSCGLISVDPYPMNCAITELNLLLNQSAARIERCAIADRAGTVHFINESNGRIIEEGGILVESRTLHQLAPDANVVKLDVEGAEYEIIPASLDQLSRVHTWIVEIHPYNKPHPDQIITRFLRRNYEVLYVNRDKNQVEPYRLSTQWHSHSTIFARRSKQ
jgi:FkbM family methyltransferase